MKAAMASALNLDKVVDRYFCDSTDEDCYGTIRLQPLIYIDDLARSSTHLNSVRAGNMKFSSMAMEKQLQFHPKKSCFLVYGPENFKARIHQEAEEEPVKLGEYKQLEKTEEKYLGDVFSSKGLSASIEVTIKDRTAKIKGSIYKLRAVVKDF